MFKTVGPVSNAIENVRSPYSFFDFEFVSFDIVSYFGFRYSNFNWNKYKNLRNIDNLLSMLWR